MLNLFQHPSPGNLIERDNPHWADLAVGLGFEPPALRGGRNGS
jgi:putative endonuclease